NPILTAQPPHGVGLGNVYSELQQIQLAPALAAQVTDHLSVGIGPIINLANLRADPGVLVTPDAANGFPTYPAATHSLITWGGGLQAGVYYTMDGGLQLGASVKSPQWFEPFHYQGVDGLGRPRSFDIRFDSPLMVSWGVGYSGFDRWLL